MDHTTAPADFLISDDPVVTPESSAPVAESAIDNLGELPHSYGTDVLIAIASDPKTLFVYWDLDWTKAFGDEPPTDRKVYLRLIDASGTEESSSVVEPLAGNSYITVANPDEPCVVELGYHSAHGSWKCVLSSQSVKTPREEAADGDGFQLATIPLHLSFQHLLGVFRHPQFDAQLLSSSIATSQLRWETDTSAERSSPPLFQPTAALLAERAEFRKQAAEPSVLRQQLARAVHAQRAWSGSDSVS